jgi:hypothetical protein
MQGSIFVVVMRRVDLRSAVVRCGDRSTDNHVSSARRLRDAGVINGFRELLLAGSIKKFISSAEAGGASRTLRMSTTFWSAFSLSTLAT